MSDELVLRDKDGLDHAAPRDMVRAASEEATVLAEIIEKKKLYANISGKRYVQVEGWTTLAAMRGCIPQEVSNVRHDDGRYEAVVNLVRIRDGAVIATGTAECGRDEPSWATRPNYALRSMAATRATSKACRLAFSWVMALAGYEVTPAEEMDGTEKPIRQPRRKADEPKPEKHGEEWVGSIREAVITKEGNSGKGPWKLCMVTGDDGSKFGTFSSTVTEFCESVAGTGEIVRIEWEGTAKGGRNILKVESASAEPE